MNERIEAGLPLLPEHMRNGMQLYIERGVPPGGFLHAVLCNDLMDAAGKADSVNLWALFRYAQFLHNYAPRECWGSQKAVKDWMKHGGLNGPQAA